MIVRAPMTRSPVPPAGFILTKLSMTEPSPTVIRDPRTESSMSAIGEMRAVGWISMVIYPSSDVQLWHREYEPPAPLANVSKLRGDLLAQVPWEHDDEVRPRRAQVGLVDDRNARAWQETALLVRRGIGNEREKVCAHATKIEKRVALGRSAIGGDAFSLALLLQEKAQECVLYRFGYRLEALVVRKLEHAGRLLAR